jgi:hypothetical protein
MESWEETKKISLFILVLYSFCNNLDIVYQIGKSFLSKLQERLLSQCDMNVSKGEETQIEAVSMTSKHKITLLLTLLLCYWHKDIFFI